MAHYYAYCFRDGCVGFSQMPSAVPEGALIFAEGEGRTFKNIVETRCRLAYNGRTYLCPGLPEGDLNGFKLWHRWAFPGQSRFLDNFPRAA